MRLLRMTLDPFKGIRSFTLDPQGRDLGVFGANASGKTTLADAFQWLLFGKDSAGKADFEVLPLDTEGKRVAGITEASVEATLAFDGGGIHDGRQVTLKRVFAEKWTKKRGKADAEFSGHETAYFIDGVPTKAGEYQGFIKGLIDEEKFRLLTNPRYFNEILKWQDRRKIITGMDGQISDLDVIGPTGELVELVEILSARKITGKTPVDDLRKIVTASLADTNKELDKLPVRIDEAQRAIPDATLCSYDAANLETMRKKRSDKASLLAQMDTGGGIAERVNTLREIEGQITDIDNLHRQAIGREISKAQAELDKAQSALRGFESDILQTDRLVASITKDSGSVEKRLQELGAAWEKATAETFHHEDVTTCYACTNPLRPDQIKDAHDKAEAAFNLTKSQKIEGIEYEGGQARAILDRAKAEIAKLQKLRADVETSIGIVKETLPGLQAKVDDLRAKQNQPSPDPERHKLADRILGLQAEIEDLKKGQNNDAKLQLQAEIRGLDDAIAREERAKANEERRQSGMKRVAELKEEQKRLGKVYEGLEHQRALCEKFVVAKAKMITERVNSRFKLARFKLFDQQINGGISDTCEVTVCGVPYSDLNNAMRINVGLDIINTLGELYGVTAPIMVDNAEAVCELLPTRAQQIRLYVSASDPVLRVEAPERVLARA